MGLRENISTIIRSVPGASECIEVLTRTHPCSPLTIRENFGVGSAAYSNAGLDISFFGESETAPELFEAPECTCSNSGIRTGARRVKRSDGETDLYIEPAPRTWSVCSQYSTVAGSLDGGGFANTALLAGPIVQQIQAACYPLVIRPRLDVCGLDIRPGLSPELVAVTANYQVTAGSGEVVSNGSCMAYQGYGGSATIHLGEATVPAGESVSLSSDFVMSFLGQKDDAAQANGGSARWCVDIFEQTSLAEDGNGGC